MGLFDKLKFKFWDDVAVVTSKLKDWRPRSCKTEKDYENSLYTYLHKELPDFQITKQYQKGRIRADLVIADKVIIELKNNLNSTSKYQRLIGQLADYKEWEGRIVVLLTGETDINLKKQLNDYLKKEGLTDTGFEDDKVTIFEK